ncbi:MAG: tRNA pseudouridine(38-40) synthase TruA [Candidatus Omnitrophota bacterium]|jgi:tRNA pseudouridine38-40 synthase
MRNLRLEIEYDGKNYCGWQSQRRLKRKKSVQETLERTLRKILQEKIHLAASGRTDAGVCALGQVANFKTESNIALKKLERALNGLLPGDISISGIEEAPLDFHSCFDAKSKIYRYSILNRKFPSALLRNKVYFYPFPLDVKLMREEAKFLLGRHDFKAFCASGSSVKDTIRSIKEINIRRVSPAGLIILEIEADGFLYNMVRNIVGTLLETGRGRFPQGSLKKILLSRKRTLAGPTVPAQGLCLVKVKYA